MMPNKKFLVLPVLLITVGVGWLLTTLGVAEEIDWVPTLTLAVVGLLAFVVGGFNNATLVGGLFLLVTSFLSVLRQTGRISLNVEMPILVVFAGVLLLVAQHSAIPKAKWEIGSSEPYVSPNRRAGN